MEDDGANVFDWKRDCQREIYLFNDRVAITFSYRPDLYQIRSGSFSRLFGAEVYLGAIWNYLLWQRPDLCSKEEFRDDIITMLISSAISHEITHEVIDEIEPSHLGESSFEEEILDEIDDVYWKDFSTKVKRQRRRVFQKADLSS